MEHKEKSLWFFAVQKRPRSIAASSGASLYGVILFLARIAPTGVE